MTTSVFTKPTSVVSSQNTNQWWKAPIINKLSSSPGVGLSVGDTYIVTGLGGDWYAAQINDIATVTSIGSPITWAFTTPEDGTSVVDLSTYQILTFNGVVWNASNSGTPLAIPDTGMARDTDASTAVNRLTSNELAQGDQAVVHVPGSVVIAHGRFSNPGDAQEGKYVLRAHTINDTFTELFLDGTNGSQRLAIPDDSTWSFIIQITAHRTDIADGHAGFVSKGVIFRLNGANTTSLQGVPSKEIISRSNIDWNINIQADATNGSIKIMVKGELGKTIRWVASVTTVEVTN